MKHIELIPEPRCIGAPFCGNDLLSFFLECSYEPIYASNIWGKLLDRADSIYMISVVRNPWEKMHHQFTSYKKNKGDLDFKSFLKKVSSYSSSQNTYIQPSLCRYQLNYFPYILDHKGNCLVDYVARYENLAEDYFKIIKTLEINIDESFNPIHPDYNLDYKDYYDQESIDLVSVKFKEEIEAFNYSYD